jgi:predicted transcriptional regulator
MDHYVEQYQARDGRITLHTWTDVQGSKVEMATVFVVARMRAGPCPPDVIARLLHTTHATLCDLPRQEATQNIQRQKGAKLPETLASLRQRPLATLQRAQVICLECGQAHRLLSSRHLVLHGLTAKDYKKKWDIPLTVRYAPRGAWFTTSYLESTNDARLPTPGDIARGPNVRCTPCPGDTSTECAPPRR